MTKGYWIAHVDVDDAEQYKKYQLANALPFKEFGARFLVRAGKNTQAEGTMRTRHVVIEFPTYEKAVACYRSDSYQAAIALRRGASLCDLVIVEGYDM